MPSPLPYKSDLFVNRDDAIKGVRKKAALLAEGEAIKNRVDFFRGHKGSGRTWLLKHLTETILPGLNGVTAHYLDLEDWPGQDPKAAVTDIVTRLQEHVSATPSNNSSDPLRNLISTLKDENIILAVCLDHLTESGTGFLQVLEEDILAPLIRQTHNVYLIMAGRGQDYVWESPEFRLHIDHHDLQRFEEDCTQEQLERLQQHEFLTKPISPKELKEIQKIGHGYPRTNYALAQQHAPSPVLKETVDDILENVTPEDRERLEAMCVLRVFFDDLLPLMLAVYHSNPKILDWGYRQINDTLNQLLQINMVRWDTPLNKEESAPYPPSDLDGYTVDRAVRPLLEQYLECTRLEMWCRLHCRALEFYRQLADDYPEEAALYQKEVDYHRSQLQRRDFAPEDCPETSEERRNA